MHEALDQGGSDGEAALDHEQARHADGVEQHGGEGRHDHDERGEEHGRDRIALLLGAGRDDLGVDARPRELVDRLEAGQHERDRKVGDVGERREGEPAAQRRVGDAAHHISRYEEGLAWKAVHEGRDDQRDEHVGYELDRDDEGGCERGTRLVEDEERERELARDTACSAEDGGKRYEREVAGPEIDVVGRGLLDPGGIGWHGGLQLKSWDGRSLLLAAGFHHRFVPLRYGVVAIVIVPQHASMAATSCIVTRLFRRPRRSADSYRLGRLQPIYVLTFSRMCKSGRLLTGF